MPRAQCEHPEDRRKRDRNQPGKVKCLDCGRLFRPRGRVVHHGTYLGYCKHRRERAGDWSWPPCESCRVAQREWVTEYNARPESVKARRLRAQARMASLAALQRMYPADYRLAYTREAEKRGFSPSRVADPPDWDQCLDRLLKAVGIDHNDLSRAVAGGWATASEREVSRQVRRMRCMLSEASKRVDMRAPSR